MGVPRSEDPDVSVSDNKPDPPALRIQQLSPRGLEDSDIQFLLNGFESQREIVENCTADVTKNENRIRQVERKLDLIECENDKEAKRTRDRLEKKFLILVSHHSSLLERLNVERSALNDVREELEKKTRELKSRLSWLAPKEVPFSVTAGHLFFVSREDAVKELVAIHKKSFAYRSFYQGGITPEIPFLDDPFGTGKSTFGAKYIELCKSLDNSHFELPEFRRSMQRARTITLRLGSPALMRLFRQSTSAAEKFLADQILRELRHLIKSGELTGDISEFDQYFDSASVLEAIIRETKTPLFIVVDEISGALSDDEIGHTERKGIFLNFCATVFSEWIKIDDLFFLLVGRGEISEILESNHSGAPFEFRRIFLKLLNDDAVERIVHMTTKFKNGIEIPLNEYFDLSDDKVLREFLERVQFLTNGHPRSLLRLFDRCESFADIVAYSDMNETEETDQWISGLVQYGEGIRKLVKAVSDKQGIDLSCPALPIKKSCSLLALAQKCLIRYENRADYATLFASPHVLKFLSKTFSPFREFISFYGRLGDLKLDHAANFELCCLKRFQEMFHDPSSPRVAFPDWFEGTIFGKLEHFTVSSMHRSIPKITDEGKRFENIDQETVKADDWPQLTSTMQSLAPKCFIPREKSAASDILIMSRAEYDGKPCFVTIGLAVKCYSTSALSSSSIKRELELFDRMFDSESNQNDNRINLLFVCCSGSPRTKRTSVYKQCGPKYSFIDTRTFTRITQAVQLDLSTEELRASFFGICKSNDSHLRQNLEDMINKQRGDHSDKES